MKKENQNLENEPRDKVKLDPWKMFYKWPAVVQIMNKAKKITKKNRKAPGTYSEEYKYNWIKKAVNLMIDLLNIDIKVEGIENWLDRGIVLAPNHQSNIDPAILIAINDYSIQQPLAFVAKKELWDDKTFGRFVRLIDSIPLDRTNPRSALDAFREAKDLIVDYKRSLVIFPEGTRSNSQEVGEFKPAALKIAQMANAPVVPVTIINSYLVFSPDRPKRVEVKVVFGKPIMPNKHISLETAALTNNVKKEVVNNLEKWKDQEMKYELKQIRKQKDQKDSKNNIKKDKKNKEKKRFKDLFKIVD